MRARHVLLGAGALILGAVAFAQSQPVDRLAGKPMPAFKMTDLAGKTHTNASLRGKVVLLDFWATWCGPCKQASPVMSDLAKKYASQGLVVVGANITDTPAAVKAYRDKHKYQQVFTVSNDALSEKLGIQGIPAFIFIDRKGVVRKVETGFSPSASAAEFESTIKKLLAAR